MTTATVSVTGMGVVSSVRRGKSADGADGAGGECVRTMACMALQKGGVHQSHAWLFALLHHNLLSLLICTKFLHFYAILAPSSSNSESPESIGSCTTRILSESGKIQGMCPCVG